MEAAVLSLLMVKVRVIMSLETMTGSKSVILMPVYAHYGREAHGEEAGRVKRVGGVLGCMDLGLLLLRGKEVFGHRTAFVLVASASKTARRTRPRTTRRQIMLQQTLTRIKG